MVVDPNTLNLVLDPECKQFWYESRVMLLLSILKNTNKIIVEKNNFLKNNFFNDKKIIFNDKKIMAPVLEWWIYVSFASILSYFNMCGSGYVSVLGIRIRIHNTEPNINTLWSSAKISLYYRWKHYIVTTNIIKINQPDMVRILLFFTPTHCILYIYIVYRYILYSVHWCKEPFTLLTSFFHFIDRQPLES